MGVYSFMAVWQSCCIAKSDILYLFIYFIINYKIILKLIKKFLNFLINEFIQFNLISLFHKYIIQTLMRIKSLYFQTSKSY